MFRLLAGIIGQFVACVVDFLLPVMKKLREREPSWNWYSYSSCPKMFLAKKKRPKMHGILTLATTCVSLFPCLSLLWSEDRNPDTVRFPWCLVMNTSIYVHIWQMMSIQRVYHMTATFRFLSITILTGNRGQRQIIRDLVVQLQFQPARRRA